MPETAENVATDFKMGREAQDRMALDSQLKAVASQRLLRCRDHAGDDCAKEGRCHRHCQG